VKTHSVRRVRNRAAAIAALGVMMVGGLANAAHAVSVECDEPNFGCIGVGYSGANFNAEGDRPNYVWVENYYGLNSGVAPDGHSSTRYAAYRLVQNGFDDPGYSFGAGGDWDQGVANHVVQDTTPAVGSIAQWDAGADSYVPGETYEFGHVAYVEEVVRDTNGTHIVVSEDSASGHTRTVRYDQGDPGWPTRYLHFRDCLEVAAVPTISGNVQIFETLTATPGTWLPAAESVEYQWTRNDVEIPGATGHEYVLTPADFDAAIRVTTTATKDSYVSASARSAAVYPQLREFDLFEVLLSGTGRIDSILTASLETSTPDVDTHFQWNRDGEPIPSATGPTYTPGLADVYTVITVTITGEKAGYVITDRSAGIPITADYFEGEASANVTGTARVGYLLTATLDHATPGVIPTYQWNRDGEAIPGATAQVYSPTDDDLAKRLSVTITINKPGYYPVPITSPDTVAVVAAVLPFDNFNLFVNGIPKVNNTLTATLQTNTDGATVTWQWQRDGVPIPLATGNKYVLRPSDLNTNISVTVTATKVGHLPTSRISTPLQVGEAEFIIGVPTISGTAMVDSTLESDVPVSTTGVALTYQWRRNSVPIPGAQLSYYTLVPADVGAYITISVTATKAGYPMIVSTPAGVTVAAANVDGFSANISGTSRVDSTLTAYGSSNTPGVAVAYQWSRDGQPISGATSQSYTLTALDFDTTITVTVTGTKPGYVTSTATSSAGVVAAEVDGLSASISGTARVDSTLIAHWSSITPGVDVTYQWRRDGEPISGATSQSYTLTTLDLGTTVTVTVTGTKPGYITATSSSSAGVVALAVVDGFSARTTGTARLDSTLTASWSSNTPGVDATYQWRRDGEPISGATSQSYKVTTLDIGTTITVTVTGTKAGYRNVSLTVSAGTIGGYSSFSFSSAPALIVGAPKVGYTVRAMTGLTTAGTTVTYEWYKNGVLRQAGGTTLALKSTDNCARITVKLTFTKAGYTTTSFISPYVTVAP